MIINTRFYYHINCRNLDHDIAVGDVNNDKLDDFFIGNASGSSGKMFIQNKDGTLEFRRGHGNRIVYMKMQVVYSSMLIMTETLIYL